MKVKTLCDFLIEIGESDLAESFERVAEATPISPLSLGNVTEDILTTLYRKLIQLERPASMTVMKFDAESCRAQRHLQKPEHPSSLDRWLSDLESTYIDFYREVKELS